jgi:hypothetical protein
VIVEAQIFSFLAIFLIFKKIISKKIIKIKVAKADATKIIKERKK